MTSSGLTYQGTTLLKIPLNEIPAPSNARITGADLNLYSQFTSDTGVNIAVRPVLQNWNLAVNGTSYDGVNNWSDPGLEVPNSVFRDVAASVMVREGNDFSGPSPRGISMLLFFPLTPRCPP